MNSSLSDLIRVGLAVWESYKSASKRLCVCGHSSMSHYMCIDCTGCSRCDCKKLVVR